MRYAEIGYHLEIDLATGNIERVEKEMNALDPTLISQADGVGQNQDNDQRMTADPFAQEGASNGNEPQVQPLINEQNLDQ